jgi:hypothetical protein
MPTLKQAELFKITGEERAHLEARILEADKERRIMLRAAKDIAAPYKERAKELDAYCDVMYAQLGETAEESRRIRDDVRARADAVDDDDDLPRPRSVAIAGDMLAKQAAKKAGKA